MSTDVSIHFTRDPDLRVDPVTGLDNLIDSVHVGHAGVLEHYGIRTMTLLRAIARVFPIANETSARLVRATVDDQRDAVALYEAMSDADFLDLFGLRKPHPEDLHDLITEELVLEVFRTNVNWYWWIGVD